MGSQIWAVVVTSVRVASMVCDDGVGSSGSEGSDGWGVSFEME